MAEVAHDGFEPLDRSTLSQQVRSRIETRIRSGELAPGSQMPSERTLSEQFEVARTSIREAMQGLVTMGLVERRGNRSYIVEHLPDVTFLPDQRKAFVQELFETRRVLEVPIVELAVKRVTDADRAALAALAAAFEQEMTLAEFRGLDRQFHTRVAQAAGNPLLGEVYGKVLDSLFRSDEFSSLLHASENQPEVVEIIRESCRDHVAIAGAVADADSEAAVAAVQLHLCNVESRILNNLQ